MAMRSFIWQSQRRLHRAEETDDLLRLVRAHAVPRRDADLLEVVDAELDVLALLHPRVGLRLHEPAVVRHDGGGSGSRGTGTQLDESTTAHSARGL